MKNVNDVFRKIKKLINDNEDFKKEIDRNIRQFLRNFKKRCSKLKHF